MTLHLFAINLVYCTSAFGFHSTMLHLCTVKCATGVKVMKSVAVTVITHSCNWNQKLYRPAMDQFHAEDNSRVSLLFPASVTSSTWNTVACMWPRARHFCS